MKCPECKETSLVITERQGIEIDYCPECRGVWLDRGELDKIIERANAAPPTTNRSRDDRHETDRGYAQGYGDEERKGQYEKKKKRGFFGELFDFD